MAFKSKETDPVGANDAHQATKGTTDSKARGGPVPDVLLHAQEDDYSDWPPTDATSPKDVPPSPAV